MPGGRSKQGPRSRRTYAATLRASPGLGPPELWHNSAPRKRSHEILAALVRLLAQVPERQGPRWLASFAYADGIIALRLPAHVLQLVVKVSECICLALMISATRCPASVQLSDGSPFR